MNTEGRRYELIAGPNKDVLFDACKYAYGQSAKVTIEFGVSAGYSGPPDHPGCAYILKDVCDIKVTGIEHEDGSGENFNIQGYCKAHLDRETGASDYTFKAFYNTKTRKGWISFFK